MALSPDLWLDHPGGDHREHPRATADQIAGATASVDAPPGCRIDRCVLAVPRLLEICPAALLQRQLIGQDAPRPKSAVARCVG